MGQNILIVLREMMENARKNGYPESAKALSTILGDMQRINKDYVGKDDLLAYIKSSIKAAEKAHEQAAKLGLVFKTDADFFQVLADLEDEFGTPQLTEYEIRNYFGNLVKFNPKINKGQLMKALKEEFPGAYDGKLAAKIAGEFH